MSGETPASGPGGLNSGLQGGSGRRTTMLLGARRDLFAWLDAQRAFRPVAVAVVALLVGLLLTPELTAHHFPDEAHLVGTPSVENIKAPFDFEVVDDETTERLRIEALAQVRRVYDHDVLAAAKTGERLAQAFAAAREAADARTEAPATRRAAEDAAQRLALEKALGVSLRSDEYAALRSVHFAHETERALRNLVVQISARPLVASRVALEPDREHGLSVQRVPADTQPPRNIDLIEQVGDIESVRQELLSGVVASNLGPEVPAPLRQPLASVAARLIEPNLTLNRAETEMQGAASQAAVKPVSIAIKKGEMIIRDGERFSRRQLMVLKALSHNSRHVSLPLVTCGGALLYLVLIATASRFAGGYGRQRFVLGSRDLLFLATLFVGGLAASRLALMVARILHESHARLPLDALLLLLPTAAGAMMVRLVLRMEVALLFALINSYILGLLPDSERMLSMYALVGTVAAISVIRTISARSDLVRAGIWAGLAQMATALGMHLLQADAGLDALLVALPAAFLGGLLSGFVALSLTPIVEWAFHYSTDLKLLELSNLNHPALKELIVQAPGSYHHSIIVGALVEGGRREHRCQPAAGPGHGLLPRPRQGL